MKDMLRVPFPKPGSSDLLNIPTPAVLGSGCLAPVAGDSLYNLSFFFFGLLCSTVDPNAQIEKSHSTF